MFCPKCGKELKQVAISCPFCGSKISGEEVSNTSGQGSKSVVPSEIRRWNWGAFTLNWIWSICNRVWIGLLCLIPYIGIVMLIILGIKGNEWAWRRKHWESIAHFKKVQRLWSIWGLVLFVLSIVVIPTAIFLLSLQRFD